MPKKNVEIINNTNYKITERNNTEKKQRRVFGSVIALVISLLLALFMRYYIAKTDSEDANNETNEVTTVTQTPGENAIV